MCSTYEGEVRRRNQEKACCLPSSPFTLCLSSSHASQQWYNYPFHPSLLPSPRAFTSKRQMHSSSTTCESASTTFFFAGSKTSRESFYVHPLCVSSLTFTTIHSFFFLFDQRLSSSSSFLLYSLCHFPPLPQKRKSLPLFAANEEGRCILTSSRDECSNFNRYPPPDKKRRKKKRTTLRRCVRNTPPFDFLASKCFLSSAMRLFCLSFNTIVGNKNPRRFESLKQTMFWTTKRWRDNQPNRQD